MSARPLPLLSGRPVEHVAPRPRPSSEAFATLAVRHLAAAYRDHGYRIATLDPLGLALRDASAQDELDGALMEFAALASDVAHVEWPGTHSAVTPAEFVAALRDTYCGTLALQAAHVRPADRRGWLYEAMERRRMRQLDGARAMHLLASLAAAGAFEAFQRARYPGHKQFSAEGCDALIPLLDALLDAAAATGVADVVLGMAHRGRLNALVNVLGLPPATALSLFTSAPDPALFAWDLKDHVGCTTSRRIRDGELRIVLAHNPSHLGSVAPVVCGMARALQERDAGGARAVLPLVVHGDAAFPGQGVVAETLNLAQARGYAIGGTVHVIVNNQIGSTIADPREARSTLFAADLARAYDAPIVHVNADDPEAAVAAASLAIEFRERFGADIVVDLCGYRRLGHFGGDDPTMTQPATQRRIRAHANVAQRYAATLAERGLADVDALARRVGERRAMLDAAADEAEAAAALRCAHAGVAAGEQCADVATAVPDSELRAIVAALARAPDDVVLHASVERRRAQWEALAVAGDGPVDWCLAETLAYATLLRNGFNVRLSGLDVGRGTFFHRDAVWHDQSRDRDGMRAYVPLRHLGPHAGRFAIFETPLSEEAVVGFEYGYSLRCGRDLVVWEAQFGDFVNNAQAIVDQFIASGERKWGYESGLVLLLPHGAEGHGPEHSSGFLGRFLALCAEGNLRVAMPSTAGQWLHLLRRQALSARRCPLVVMTPKTALRSCTDSFTPLSALAAAAFEPLIGDALASPERVTRAVVVSGKLRHDIVRARAAGSRDEVAILGLDELYPFPQERLRAELARYPRLATVCFAQEEPRNHGAWHVVRDSIEAALPPRLLLVYSGPPPAAPSGGCDPAARAAEQRAIVAEALGSR